MEVLHRPAVPLDLPHANYPGLNPSKTILPNGYPKRPDSRGFEAASIWEGDVEIPMRDGIRLRGDVFRPADTDEKVPINADVEPLWKIRFR
jgi:uncharacterized protein